MKRFSCSEIIIDPRIALLFGVFMLVVKMKSQMGYQEKKWYLDLYNAKKLLEEEVTRSKSIKFSFSSKELEGRWACSKKMKPQNQEKGMPGLNVSNTTPLADVHVTSIQMVSSLASSLQQNSSSPSYWCLSEAKKMFHLKGNEVTALDAVNNQIELLLQASSSPNGYFDVMDCGGRTIEEIIEEISDHQRWMVQQKVSILLLALTIAKKIWKS